MKLLNRSLLALPLALAVACGGNNDNNGDTNNGGTNNGTVATNNGTAGTNNGTTVAPNNGEGEANLVDVATETGFDSLVSAAVTAGLDATLADGGPFTVFAPTDEAFAALGDAAPSDPDLLANVLLHHVVPGSLDSAAVTAEATLDTAANTQLTVADLPLSETLDVEASNGIIHVIDEVLLPPTILEAAAATADLSTLVTAVDASSDDVKTALAAEGPITVFAPVNSAFAAIPEADLNALLADQAALDGVLTYHVAGGQTLAGDLSDGQTITMANGSDVTVSIEGSSVSLVDAAGNASAVVGTDIRLANGVVHLIDGVLMPTASPNIVEVADAVGDFTTLLSAATATGLDAALSGDGPLTVFAPTDAAFTALGVDLSPVSGDVIANILLHHVVGGEYTESEVAAESAFTSLANLPLAVDTSASPVEIGGADLSTTTDVVASNGVIHVMDQVIVPPTILEVAGATADLSTLVTAVGASSAGVQAALAPSTLTGDAPITVFAPTNAAFAASGIDLGTVAQADLDAVLSHHAAAGQALSTDLTDGQTVTTLNGDITINVAADGSVSITDGAGNTANVVATLVDIRTLTGVVHVIDAVLLPAP